MAIEKKPAHPLPRGYIPHHGIEYRVKTGDDLGLVARRHGVTEEQLVSFNFRTRDPAEINWYLRRNVGCKVATRDGNNWMFTSGAHPGIIYIPPAWHRPSFPTTAPLPSLPIPRPPDHPEIWFGLGAQEGGMFGIAGKDTVEACLYSSRTYHNRFWINIDGWRLGLGLGASIGVALVIATGIDKPQDLQGFVPEPDLDFSLNLAGKWGDIAKAAKSLKAISKVAKAGKFIDKALSVAEWDKLRDLIWDLYKANGISPKRLGLTVLGIPGAGVGLEASVYESAGDVFVHDVTLGG
jgi:LysM domain